jgi:glycosyltransferase involved in cell wall biosynthesis
VQANLSAIRAALRAQGDTAPGMVITRADGTKAEPDVFRPSGALDLFATLLFLDFGIIHLHLGGNLTTRLLLLAAVCSLLPGRRSVLTFHSGGYPSTPAGQSARPQTLRGLIFRRFDRIIGVNAEIVEMFKRFGVHPDRVRLIYPHAIPRVDQNLAIPPAIQTFLDQHSKVMVSVGLLEPEYDLPAQIDLLNSLREDHPEAGLIMIGSGSLEADLRARIAASPAREHVLLVGDLDHAITVRVLTECHLMLRTTLYDGDSISVREALALGLPVIATDNGMRPDGVKLIPASEPEALFAATSQILAAGDPPPTASTDQVDNIAEVLAVYRELSPTRS